MSSSRHSIKRTLLLAWLIPAGLALALSIGAFGLVGWVEYRNSVSRISSDLLSKSKAVARRLSGELLIGPKGAPQVVSENLRADLGLSEITLSRQTPNCLQPQLDTDGACLEKMEGRIQVVRPVPFVQDPQFVRVNVHSPTYWAGLNFKLLLWSTLPVALLFALGIIAQRRLLKRHLIEPIQELVAQPSGRRDLPDHWPSEISELSQRLDEAFLQRDQALIGQIASGVIHDLKTKLHPVMAASDLVKEVAPDSPKRPLRLENLLKTCSTNLPKVRDIIQTVLDGSRDIAVDRRDTNLERTISEAVQALQEMAGRHGVKVETFIPSAPIALAHDPVQLERVLTNLIKNGIESFEGQSISDREVRVTLTTQDGEVKISVEDSGPGLTASPESLLSSVRSTKPHGTGLGLVVSRKIIEAHRGTLSASRSDSLSGAKFQISLPMEAGEA